jgi:hypothetical protein
MLHKIITLAAAASLTTLVVPSSVSAWGGAGAARVGYRGYAGAYRGGYGLYRGGYGYGGLYPGGYGYGGVYRDGYDDAASRAAASGVSSAGYGYGDVYPLDYGYYSSDGNVSDTADYNYVR